MEDSRGTCSREAIVAMRWISTATYPSLPVVEIESNLPSCRNKAIQREKGDSSLFCSFFPSPTIVFETLAPAGVSRRNVNRHFAPRRNDASREDLHPTLEFLAFVSHEDYPNNSLDVALNFFLLKITRKTG